MSVWRPPGPRLGSRPPNKASVRLNPEARSRLGLIFACPMMTQPAYSLRNLVTGEVGTYEDVWSSGGSFETKATEFGRVHRNRDSPGRDRLNFTQGLFPASGSLADEPVNISCWLLFDSDAASGFACAVGDDSSATDYFGIKMNTNYAAAWARGPSGEKWAYQPNLDTHVTRGKWLHIVAQYDGAAWRRLTLNNGVKIVTATSSTGHTTEVLDVLSIFSNCTTTAASSTEQYMADIVIGRGRLWSPGDINKLYQPNTRWSHYQSQTRFISLPSAAAATTTTVFRAPRPAWTRPPPNVIGVSEPTRTAFLFSQGDQRLKGASQGDPAGPIGTAGAIQTAKGRAYHVAGSSLAIESQNNRAPSSQEFSITMLLRLETISDAYAGLINWTEAAHTTSVCGIFRDLTNDKFRLLLNNTTYGTTAAGACTAIDDGEWHWVSIVVSGILGNWKYYVDGELLFSPTATMVTPTTAADNHLHIGATRSAIATQQIDGDYAAVYVLDRTMSAAEVRHRHSPQGQWDWLRTAPQRFIETAAAAGGDVDVDVSATVGAIIITAQNPTVSIDHDVAAALGALTITAHNPTVSIDHDISAAAGSIAISALNPTVSIDHDVDAALGAITLTAHDPSVDSTTNVELGGLTITGHKASVSIPSADVEYYRPWTHARLSEQPDKNQFGDDPMNTNLSPPSVIDGRKMGTKATNLKRAVGGVEKSASKAGKGKQTKSTDKKR